METIVSENRIQYGQYVIIQRQNYNKLHLLTENCVSICLGRDKVDLSAVIGTYIGSSFKMIPKKGTNREFTLNICYLEECVSSDILLKDISSGTDNRNIIDDGSSQLLSSDSILGLRDKGISPQQIVGQLIENSKTFRNKTEYSQEKYLKKKDKKYFEYITLHRPTLRLLAEIFYNRDAPKTIGMRIDTLSQITTAVNFQPDGTYILIESGFHGLITATCLNNLSDKGRLILVTPGSQCQKQAVLAMNFSDAHLSRLLTVRASTLIQHLDKSKPPTINKNEQTSTYITNNVVLNSNNLITEHEPSNECIQNNVTEPLKDNEISVNVETDVRKRKHSNDEVTDLMDDNNKKKPKWTEEAENASDIIQLKNLDGLIVACKEFPLNMLNTFLKFVAPSRPFVVYSLYQETLVKLYVELKKRRDIIYLRITETWLRKYQVLPNRTHPAVNMSPTSGFLLTGVVVLNEI